MLIDNKIRQLIPVKIKRSTYTLSSEVEQWLEQQNILATVESEYYNKQLAHAVTFKNQSHELMFRLKYSEYII